MAHIRAAFLANHIEIRDSLSYVSGGFPEWWTVTKLPDDQNIVLGLVLEMESEAEAEQEINTTVDLYSPSGRNPIRVADIKSKRGRGPVVKGAPLYHPVIVSTLVHFTESGAHRFAIKTGKSHEDIRFAVRVKE